MSRARFLHRAWSWQSLRSSSQQTDVAHAVTANRIWADGHAYRAFHSSQASLGDPAVSGLPQSLGWAAAALATLACTAVTANAAEPQGAQGVQGPGSQSNPSSIPVSETAVHPLDYDPVTNEHTAKMTMARSAALEYYQNGRYAQAEAKFKEAIEEAKLGFDPKDPHIPSCINNLAELYRNLGQYDKAGELYKEALERLEAAYGERHWLYVSAMHNLALNYQAAGDLPAARDTMEKVMKLRLTMFGARHFLYADSMYAFGHILVRQAQEQGQEGQASSAQGSPSVDQPTKRRWWGMGGGGGRESTEALDKRGLQLMRDAVGILEDAESVQTNVVLHWLSTLRELYEQRGRDSDALQCARKALYHFTNDKGEVHANASELSDQLISLLLKTGRVQEARDVAASCAAARQELFGRDLVVAQAWLRLAVVENQMKQVDTQAMMQHARNAAVLSDDISQELSKTNVGNWLGQKGKENAVKRARAAHVQASALQFIAEHTPLPQPTPNNSSSAAPDPGVASLEAAVAVLDRAIADTARQLKSVSGEQLDDLSDLYIDMQVQLVECLDLLAGRLEAMREAGERVRSVRARQEEVSAALLAGL